MRAGNLNKRVTIEQPTPGQGAAGGPTQTWETLAQRWAAIEPLSGRELMQADQMGYAASVKITMRYGGLSDVDEQCRVVFGTRTFDINSPINTNEANEELVLMCTEG